MPPHDKAADFITPYDGSAAMLIIEHFLRYHRETALARFNEDSADALMWAKDAAKLETARRLLADISFGPGDWFVDWDFTSTDED